MRVAHAEGIHGRDEGAIRVWIFSLGRLVAGVAQRDEIRRIMEALDIDAGRDDMVDGRC